MSGFFYVGGKTANSVNGYVKIGETGMSMTQRTAMLRDIAKKTSASCVILNCRMPPKQSD